MPWDTVLPTHYHTIVNLGDACTDLDEHGAVTRVLHEVTCVFQDDPTNDDRIAVEDVWLDEGQDRLVCPVCGDEVDR